MALTLFARRKDPVIPEKPKPQKQRLLSDLEQIESMPHFSGAIVKAMELVNDPEGTLSDMADLVRKDTMLATAMFRAANSVAYASTAPITDLLTAVKRLGFRGCANLISALSMKDLYRSYSQNVQETCEVILRHSLFTAVIATAINKILRHDLNGNEFTSALLHDIGRLVICVKGHDEFIAANLDENQSENICAIERAVLGADHCGVGGCFAVKNSLPVSMGRVILNHHTPGREGDYRSLVGLVALSDSLANHVQWKRNVARFVLDTANGFPEAIRGVDPSKIQQLRQRLPKLVVECFSETRQMIRTMS